MDQWKGKVAIVTGASAGIGAAIAQALVHHGMVVVGLARRQDKMEELAAQLTQANEPGKFHPVKCDLKQEEDILAAFDWVEKELGGADVLVNNAGTSDLNTIQGGVTEQWRNMFHLNLLAVCICTREYLKSMDKRKNQQGHIFVINSITGHEILGGHYGVYSSTKYAVKAVTQCLRRELAEKNSSIKVTSVSPGLTETEMTENILDDLDEGTCWLESSDVAQALVDVLSTSPVAQICEVILTPVPSNRFVF
ncbi:farnesol dehydrogenase-like isoform X3 [Homalodisca vitripennis]|uniref:farnesol dehydrogenase-like isoform X2 n=1 Tax=Homalodisca vitripennis TaxID=197043 RepID=UPI001EEB3E8D|nr:farnesol dehydrogenase-like isoform X2 [Homalodisca vitripennis]XP_046674519.1 farnesol dehydrogenase-like isoform X3 [Homalodisca vitripennis]